MELTFLQSALNQVLGIESEEEMPVILEKYPDLLDDVLLENIEVLQNEAERAGDDSAARSFRVILVRLVYHRSAVVDPVHYRQAKPVEPTVAWAIAVREYIARGLPELLQKALAEAEKKEEPEIAQFLQFYFAGAITDSNRVLRKLRLILQESDRKEELLTLELLNWQTWALRSTRLYDYPQEEQKGVRDSGVRGCLQAVRISAILQDLPCQVLFINVLAASFRISGIPIEAIYYYKNALKICRKLTERDESVFSHYIVMNLTEIGSILLSLRRWEEAESYFGEALQITLKIAETEPGVMHRGINLILNLGAVLYYQKKWERCDDLYNYWLPVLLMILDGEPHYLTKEMAEAFNNLGYTQIQLKKPTDAESSFDKALELFLELAKKESISGTDLARTQSYVGAAKYSLDKYAEAEENLTESIRLYREANHDRLDITDKDITRALCNLGLAKSNQQKFAEAESFYRETLKAFQVYAESEPEIYSSESAKFLSAMGIVQREQQRLPEAEDSLIRAIAILRKSGSQDTTSKADLAENLNILACVQNKKLDQTKAEMAFVESINLFRELAKVEPEIYKHRIAAVLNNLGMLLREEQRAFEAKEITEEAISLERELAKTGADIYRWSIANLLNSLGNIQRDLHQLEDSEKSYFEALELFDLLTDQDSCRENKMLVFNNLGLTQLSQENWAEAEKNLKSGLNIGRSMAAERPVVHDADLAMTLLNIGTAEFRQEKWEDAKISYRESMELYGRLAEDRPHVYNRSVAGCLANLGFMYFEKGNFDKSSEYFQKAIDLIEDTREKVFTLDDRNRIMQEFKIVYDGLLSCCYQLKNWEKVLEIAERGKSRSLSDLLSVKSRYPRPKLPSDESTEIVMREAERYWEIIKQLQLIESSERDSIGEIAAWQYYKERNADAPAEKSEWISFNYSKKDSAQKNRFALAIQLEDALSKIHKYDPDFPPKVKEITNKEIFAISRKTDRTIIVFRVLPESTIIIFVFPNGDLQVKEITTLNRAKLYDLYWAEWRTPYYEWKENMGDIERWKDALEAFLNVLDENLMIHVRKILDERKDVKEILFVPNQVLALFPLHAASWTDADGERHYFLEKYITSYAPSISVFKHCTQNETTRTGGAFFIANPRGDLEFAEREIEGIKNHDFCNPHHTLQGKKATRQALIALLEANLRFIHFSCHGFHSLYNTFDSGLVMADGILSLSEILNLNLGGNWLAILSACETGMVDFRSQTDEHFSLPLGFIFAGSSTVWASLWPVDDYTTSDLMINAYENLSKKEYKNSKAAALRQAQLATKDEFSHPIYWAGFQNFGV